jgi:hypothetical protein
MLGAVLLLALPTAAVGYTATVVWTFTAGERSIAKVGYCRTTYNSKGSRPVGRTTPDGSTAPTM